MRATFEPHLRFTRRRLAREGRGLERGRAARGEIGREPRALEVRDQRSEIDAAPGHIDALAIGVEVPARGDVGAAAVARERPAAQIEAPVGEAQAAAGGERTEGIPAQARAAKVGLDAQALRLEREPRRAFDLAGGAQLGEELAHDVRRQTEVGFEGAVELRALAQSPAHGKVGARAFELGLLEPDLGTGDLALDVKRAGVEHPIRRRAHAGRCVGARGEAGGVGPFERESHLVESDDLDAFAIEDVQRRALGGEGGDARPIELLSQRRSGRALGFLTLESDGEDRSFEHDVEPTGSVESSMDSLDFERVDHVLAGAESADGHSRDAASSRQGRSSSSRSVTVAPVAVAADRSIVRRTNRSPNGVASNSRRTRTSSSAAAAATATILTRRAIVLVSANRGSFD